VKDALMTISISTQAVAEAIEDPECVVVDVREMAAFNGWTFHHEARGGHLRGAVAFPLERIFPAEFGERRTISKSYLHSCSIM
jgi:3-mercaptopyruvate sulfurtransferase SseA